MTFIPTSEETDKLFLLKAMRKHLARSAPYFYSRFRERRKGNTKVIRFHDKESADGKAFRSISKKPS